MGLAAHYGRTAPSALTAGPVYAHGRDKSGRPIVWIRPRLDLEDEEPQVKLMRMVGVLEAVRRVADESGFVLVCERDSGT